LRELEWQIRFNLVVKWWVGYPVFAAGPDHTTLERFELWVCFHQHRTMFDQVLCQIDHDFPRERQQAQIGDSYALRAHAAKESLVRLLRHACQRLLAALAEVDPAREAQVRAQLDLSALWGAKDELGEYHLKPEERAARLQTTVLAAQTCARQVRTSLEQPVPLAPKVCASVRQWLAYLDKLIADEVHLSADDTGQVTQVTERAADDKGSYRLGSATDPDATYRVHGDDKKDFGYNVNLAVTDNFVREIQADTGAQPDPVAIPDLLQAQREHHDLVPDKLIYDAAAGSGKTRAQVAQATDGQTQLVSPRLAEPIVPYEKRTDRFTPDRFQLSDEGALLTCPNGQATAIAYRSGSGDGRVFRFLGQPCRDCPLWTQCRSQKPGSQAMRQVFTPALHRRCKCQRLPPRGGRCARLQSDRGVQGGYETSPARGAHHCSARPIQWRSPGPTMWAGQSGLSGQDECHRLQHQTLVALVAVRRTTRLTHSLSKCA